MVSGKTRIFKTKQKREPIFRYLLAKLDHINSRQVYLILNTSHVTTCLVISMRYHNHCAYMLVSLLCAPACMLSGVRFTREFWYGIYCHPVKCALVSLSTWTWTDCRSSSPLCDLQKFISWTDPRICNPDLIHLGQVNMILGRVWISKALVHFHSRRPVLKEWWTPTTVT